MHSNHNNSSSPLVARDAIGSRSGCGQISVGTRSDCGQDVVRSWSDFGWIAIRFRSDRDWITIMSQSDRHCVAVGSQSHIATASRSDRGHIRVHGSNHGWLLSRSCLITARGMRLDRGCDRDERDDAGDPTGFKYYALARIRYPHRAARDATGGTKLASGSDDRLSNRAHTRMINCAG